MVGRQPRLRVQTPERVLGVSADSCLWDSITRALAIERTLLTMAFAGVPWVQAPELSLPGSSGWCVPGPTNHGSGCFLCWR